MASRDVLGFLNAASVAIQARLPRTALIAVREAWRILPHEVLADLVECISAKLTRARGPLRVEGRSQKARLEAFVSTAHLRDIADVGRLRDDLENAMSASSQVVLSPRVDALGAFGPDPRIGLPMARWLAGPMPEQLAGNAGKKLWTRFFKVLEAAGDPRVARLLDAVGPTLNGATPAVTEWLQRRAAKAVLQVTKKHPVPPALDPGAAALVTSLRRDIAALDDMVDESAPAADAAVDEQTLLERALADVADEDCRMVLADLWQQQGNPRGELLVLQMARRAGTLSKAGARREAKLIKSNLDAWLGPLAKAIQRGGVVFEGGFPSILRLRKTPVRAMGTLRDLDAWRTVHTVSFEGRSFFSPQMTSLRHAFRVCSRGLDELVQLPCAQLIETLTLAEQAALEVVTTAAGWGALRHLGVTAQTRSEALMSFANTDLFGQLETLILPVAPDIADWWSRVTPLPPITVRFVSAPWAHRRAGAGWSITVTTPNDWSTVSLDVAYRGTCGPNFVVELERLAASLGEMVVAVDELTLELPDAEAIAARRVESAIAAMRATCT